MLKKPNQCSVMGCDNVPELGTEVLVREHQMTLCIPLCINCLHQFVDWEQVRQKSAKRLRRQPSGDNR